MLKNYVEYYLQRIHQTTIANSLVRLGDHVFDDNTNEWGDPDGHVQSETLAQDHKQ